MKNTLSFIRIFLLAAAVTFTGYAQASSAHKKVEFNQAGFDKYKKVLLKASRASGESATTLAAYSSIETNMRANVCNSAGSGACGMTQFMPGTWATQAVIGATGSWSRPFVPAVPGIEEFAGRQLHSARYAGPAGFTGRRVLVVEDTSTTGGSPLTAVEACREAGAEVVAVAVIADRSSGAGERIEAETGVPYRFAYGLEDLGLA